MKKSIDHLGKVFKSIKEMCEHHGVSYQTYINRIRLGWSIEKALSSEKRDIEYGGAGVKSCDHLGVEYGSISEMCRAYGISKSCYDHRVKVGMSVEQALTTKVGEAVKIVDHLGNEYKSVLDMCEKYGITKSTYFDRKKRGYTLKEALTKKTTYSRPKEVLDHKGVKFESLYEMCNAYGVGWSVYISRIKKGWDKERALTTEVKHSKFLGRRVEDHLGNKYYSKDDMCVEYGISRRTFDNRMLYGWGLERALTEKVR
jgi:hypothetical protein